MESRFSRLAIEALFPRFCASCKKEGSLLCEACERDWMPQSSAASCPFCGRAGSSRTCFSCAPHVFLDGLTFVAPYGNPIMRALISSWKYDRDRSAEPALINCLRRNLMRLSPPVLPFFASSVPLHQKRRRQRGFDQAQIFTEWVALLFGIPHEEYLIRTRSTSSQARTQHTSRLVGEMDGVFVVKPDVHIPEHILLCDDVFTSGTTMDAAARTLKESGAKTVWGFVLAKG